MPSKKRLSDDPSLIDASSPTTEPARRTKKKKRSHDSAQDATATHGRYWTEEQRKALWHHMPAWLDLVKKVDPTYSQPNNAQLNKWKDTTVETVFATPLFDMAPADHKRLKLAAKKIFINKYAADKKKFQLEHGGGHNPVACNKGMVKVAAALAKLKSLGYTGKSYFREQHRAEIQSGMEDVDCLNNGGAFERALTALWEAEPDKEGWEAKAKAAIDIPKSRIELIPLLMEALSCLCRCGHLGDMEMLLFFAHRDHNNVVISGSLSGHCNTNEQCLEQSLPDGEYDTFMSKWAAFNDSVLPRAVLDSTVSMECDGDGIPCFPHINLEDTSPAQLRALIKSYLNAVWAFSWPFDKEVASVPWTKIMANSDVYYDAANLPVPIQDPDLYTVSEVLALSAHWMATRSKPFTFFSKEEIVENETSVVDESDVEESHPAQPEEYYGGEDEPPLATPPSARPPLLLTSDVSLEGRPPSPRGSAHLSPARTPPSGSAPLSPAKTPPSARSLNILSVTPIPTHSSPLKTPVTLNTYRRPTMLQNSNTQTHAPHTGGESDSDHEDDEDEEALPVKPTKAAMRTHVPPPAVDSPPVALRRNKRSVRPPKRADLTPPSKGQSKKRDKKRKDENINDDAGASIDVARPKKKQKMQE